MEFHPDAAVCQMDSVVIHPGGQAILTVFFTTCDLQLMFLRERNTSASVTKDGKGELYGRRGQADDESHQFLPTEKMEP